MGEWSLDVADPASAPHFGAGWSGEVEGPGPMRHRWSTAGTAWLTVPVEASCRRLSVSVTGVPFLVPGLVDHQQVWLFVEGAQVAVAFLDGPGTLRGHVPDHVFRPDRADMLVAIVLPGATVPADVGAGADQRRLGLALQRVTLAW